ncbi:hypothetical protein SAMN05216516_10970 [Izhakiella capsodis]|uniref:Uncharacterized protein n=1 Tax=Izhakiella capsodis TaxID=1367852 RepID=A0A1I4ZND1_9GAMM|nr:hypothetical protein SAMN05216516_10970 [Izhakiella capsodis]
MVSLLYPQQAAITLWLRYSINWASTCMTPNFPHRKGQLGHGAGGNVFKGFNIAMKDISEEFAHSVSSDKKKFKSVKNIHSRILPGNFFEVSHIFMLSGVWHWG